MISRTAGCFPIVRAALESSRMGAGHCIPRQSKVFEGSGAKSETCSAAVMMNPVPVPVFNVEALLKAQDVLLGISHGQTQTVVVDADVANALDHTVRHDDEFIRV